MKRFLKISRVVLVLAMVLVIAGLVFWTFFLPGIVESEVRQALTDIGFRSVELEVRGLSTHHATVSGISIGEDRRLTVGSADVDFDLEGLSSIRIETVRLTGAVLEVRYEDGEIDLGPLRDIDTGESDGDGELPFERVELAASMLLLKRDGVTDRIPIDGTVANSGGGSLNADIRTSLFGRELRIRGDIISVAGKLRAELTASAGIARVEYDWSGPRDILHVALDVEEGAVDALVGDHRLRTDRLHASGSFTLLGFDDIVSSDIEIRIRGFSVDGVAIDAATVRAHRIGEDLDIAVQGTRGTGSDGGTTLRLSSQLPTSIAAILDPEPPRRFQLELNGAVPAEVVDLIREAGLEPEAPFTASARGEGVFQWRSGDFEIALSLAELKLRAGSDPLHPELLVETYYPGQVAYDASGRFRLRLPRLWTEVVTPEVLKFVEPGLLAAAGLHLESAGGRIEATFDYETDEHLVFKSGDAEARSAWLRLEGKAVVVDGALAALDSHAEITADWLRVPQAGLSVKGFEAKLPLLHGPVDSSEGSFTTGEVAWEGRRFPGLSGDLAGKPGSVSFSAKWPISTSEEMLAAGGIRLTGGRPNGIVSFWGRQIPVGEDGRVGKLLRELTGLAFTGRLAFDGSLPFGPRAGEPSVRAELTEGMIADPKGSLSLEGVDLAVALEDFSPMSTPGSQRLRFEGGKIGEFLLGNGEVAFRVDGPKQVAIEDARWEFGRSTGRLGRFWARPFQFDPGDLEIDTTLFCEGFDLSDWLSIVAPEGTIGQGTLYGRLPFVVRTRPKLSATFGQGYLFAEGGGWLRVMGTEEYVKEHIPATGPSAEYTEVVQRRIIHALENFNFEKLRFDLIEKDDGLTLRVGVVGRGADVLEGTVGNQELDLTLNFNGVDSLIGPALDASLGIKRLSELIEGSLRGGLR